MIPVEHTVETLFEQLGLDADDAARARFVEEHGPLPADTVLADAPFWSDAQAAFLREALAADSPWALPVDELDAQLR